MKSTADDRPLSNLGESLAARNKPADYGQAEQFFCTLFSLLALSVSAGTVWIVWQLSKPLQARRRTHEQVTTKT